MSRNWGGCEPAACGARLSGSGFAGLVTWAFRPNLCIEWAYPAHQPRCLLRPIRHCLATSARPKSFHHASASSKPSSPGSIYLHSTPKCHVTVSRTLLLLKPPSGARSDLATKKNTRNLSFSWIPTTPSTRQAASVNSIP